MSILKNLVVQQRDNPLGADYIIKYVGDNAKLTQNAYWLMLNKLRLNKTKEAEEAFIECIGTDLAKEMANLLVDLDRLNPADLEESILSRQNYIREVKKTKLIRRGQLSSDIAYIPVVISLIWVFMNFVVIAFYLQEKTKLAQFLM